MVFNKPKNVVPIKINNNYEVKVCPFCGSHNTKQKFDFEYMRPIVYSTCQIELERNPSLWECCACEACFCSEIVSEQDSVKLYKESSSAERWDEKRTFEKGKSKEIIGCMNKYFLLGKSVLDIGCNTGELLDYAKSRGCVPLGVEYSVESRAALISKGYKSFSSIDDVPQKVDVITAFDLLEHLYNPGDFLEKCYDLLNDGGYFIALTGNISSLSAKVAKKRWWYMRYPEHISFISKKFCRRNKLFELKEWLNTFAMIEHENVLGLKSALSLLGKENRNKYIGIPALNTDHILIVLKKAR